MERSKIADELRELAESIDDCEGDLPTFGSYEMEMEVNHGLNGFNIYRDHSGHYWFEPDTGIGAFCTGTSHEKFLDAIQDA